MTVRHIFEISEDDHASLVTMTSQTAPDWQLQIGESGASSRYNFNLDMERLVCKQTALAA
jgi:hypothetical protein